MGKISILTPEQEIILDEIKNNHYLNSKFYLTGGTALSAFYLQHRYSENLDFFSETRLDNQVLITLVGEWAKKYHFTFQSRFVEVVYIFELIFPNRAPLKIDPFLVASDFLKVEDFEFLPKMISSLTLEELKNYFTKRAKEMGLKEVI